MSANQRAMDHLPPVAHQKGVFPLRPGKNMQSGLGNVHQFNPAILSSPSRSSAFSPAVEIDRRHTGPRDHYPGKDSQGSF